MAALHGAYAAEASLAVSPFANSYVAVVQRYVCSDSLQDASFVCSGWMTFCNTVLGQ
jgi:hypothetical protein